MDWIAVAGLLVAAIGLLITWLSYRRAAAKSRKHLMYRIQTNRYSKSLFVTQVAFMNIGRDDILSTDFDGGKPLRIDLGVPIYGELRPQLSNKANGMELTCSRRYVSIEPTLIGHEGFVIGQYLTFLRPEPRVVRTLRHIPVTPLGKMRPQTRKKVGLFFVSFALIWFGVLEWDSPYTWLRTVSAALELTMLLTMILTVMSAAASWWSGPFTFRSEIWDWSKNLRMIRERGMVVLTTD